MRLLLQRIFNRAKRISWYPNRRHLRNCKLGPGAAAAGRVNVKAEGLIEIDRMVTLLDGLAPTTLECEKDAELTIGAYSIINYGSRISARKSVKIGSRCMFAAFLEIDDSAGGTQEPAPIVVEDDVWLAHAATIRPGVRIGRGAVVAAGSVVTSDVPAGMLAIGNPARIVSLDVVAHGAPPKQN